MFSLAIGDVASLPAEDGKRVIIIGAGVAGLAAAQKLRWKKLNPVILEARPRVGGRVLTTRLGGPTTIAFRQRAEGAPSHDPAYGTGPPVDCGASVLTAFELNDQWVARHAREAKIRAPICVGGGLYETTDSAAWYDKGLRLPQKRIQSLHEIVYKALYYANSYAVNVETPPGEEDMDVGKLMSEAVAEVERANGLKLSKVNRMIVRKILVRTQAYACPFSDLPLESVKEWVQGGGANRFPPKRKELEMGDDNSVRQLAEINELEMRTPPKVIRAHENRAHNVRHDRIVLDGYSPFLIDRLAENLNVCLSTIVKTIEVSDGDDKPKVAVTTHDGTEIHADYAIVTLPLGVLKKRDQLSSVEFRPPLSEAKQEAIQKFGMGVHNKVILWFKETDVFWPEKIGQFNCADERFQFLNLHAYGHKGLLIAHVFNGSGFANGYWSLNDSEVVNCAVEVLHGMFLKPKKKPSDATSSGDAEMQDPTLSGNANDGMEGGDDAEETASSKSETLESRSQMPRPLDYVVTRWDQDPFAFGSYSFWKKGSDWETRELGRPEYNDRIFFAGEHTDPDGWQCVEGAYRSGVKAAHDVLVAIGDVRGTARVCDIPSLAALNGEAEATPKKRGRRSSKEKSNGAKKGGAASARKKPPANGSKKGKRAKGYKQPESPSEESIYDSYSSSSDA